MTKPIKLRKPEDMIELKHLAPYENKDIHNGYDGEEWLDHPLYSQYRISTHGRVFSKDKYVNHNHGGVALKKGRILSQTPNHGGYLMVGLTFNKKTKTIAVSRLVAETFIPNPENKPQVNHINGIKTNNHISNLEWNTSGENVMHSWANGLAKKRHSYVELQKRLDQILKYASYEVRVKTPKGIGIIKVGQSRLIIEYEDSKRENLVKSVRFYGDRFLLVLHNLSDLTEEIEHNGERFVPVDELSKFTSIEINSVNQIYEADREGEMQAVEKVTYLSYHQVNNMFKWHFDVFGLIDKGLAINMNDYD